MKENELIALMHDRGYTLHMTNGSRTYFSFCEDIDINQDMSFPRIQCDVFLDRNTFKLNYVTNKNIIFTTNELGSIENDTHFSMWYRNILKCAKAIKWYEEEYR